MRPKTSEATSATKKKYIYISFNATLAQPTSILFRLLSEEPGRNLKQAASGWLSSADSQTINVIKKYKKKLKNSKLKHRKHEQFLYDSTQFRETASFQFLPSQLIT